METKEAKETKPGVKTSELWTVLIVIFGALAPLAWATMEKYPAVAAVIAVSMALLGAAYTGMRTWLKKEEAGEVDLLTTDQEAAIKGIMDKLKELAEKIKPPAGPTVMTLLLIGVLLAGCCGGCMQPFVAREAARAERGVDNWLANRETIFAALTQYQTLANERADELLADAVKAAPDSAGVLIQKEVAARIRQAQDIAAFRAADDENAREVRASHARMVRAARLFGSKEDVSARLDSIERVVLKALEKKGP